MTSQTPTLSTQEKHRRSQHYARLTYGLIILTFLSVCAIAVVATMVTESNREGFRPITVSKPISFFDYTYVDKNKKAAPKTPSQTPEKP